MKRHLVALSLALSSTLVLAEPITLSTGSDYAPYADSKLPEGGMTTMIVKRAFAETKTEVKVSWEPWARAMDDAKNGTAAGSFPWFKTPEREKDFLYSSPIYDIKQHAFYKAGGKLDFGNLASLKGSKLCLPLGWAPPSKLSAMIAAGQLSRQEPKDIATCAQMVAAGRADFFVTDVPQGNDGIKASGLPAGTIAVSDAVLEVQSLHFIVGKSGPNAKANLEKFEQGLEAIRKSGVYAKAVGLFNM